MSIHTEAIEAAARAMDTRALPRDNAIAALSAAPYIQAAALRDAAVDLCAETCGDNYAPDRCETCRAVETLRARADQLEAETK